MNDENYRLLVIVVVVFLVVSLLMNALLAADPALVRGPPVRIHGFIDANGRPADGYYVVVAGAVPAGSQPDATPVLQAPPVP